MSLPSAKILVAVAEGTAWIRICGRANFLTSVEFKTLVNELFAAGHRKFTLDLGECALMDSTFLGVLAGFGMRFRKTAGAGEITFELCNANERVTGLLTNLGVAHLFTLVSGTVVAPDAGVERPAGEKPDAETTARTCLEAHETLMAIEPKNIPKFKDVAQFFAEDLKNFKTKPD